MGMEERNRAAKIRFRSKVEAKLGAFQSDSEAKTLKFPPMDRYQRSVVHDVAEIAGLATYSFGEEEVDRFIQVWKKEFSPCEGELAALRNGKEWDPVKALQEQQEEEWRSKLELERSRTLNKVQPKTNYQEKYHHLIGTESALEGARKTETNISYGMVSSESKKDRRTVEDIQAELRAKKKLKVENDQEAVTGLDVR